MITKFALQEVWLLVKLFEVYWEAYLRDLLQTQFAHYIIEQASCLLEYHLNDFKIRIGKKKERSLIPFFHYFTYIFLKKVILHWCLVIAITIFITLTYNINIFIIPILCDLEKLERQKIDLMIKNIHHFSHQNHVSSYGHVLDFF